MAAAPGHDHADRQLAYGSNRDALRAFASKPSAAPVEVFDCPRAQGPAVVAKFDDFILYTII